MNLLIESSRDSAALELAPHDQWFYTATLRGEGISGTAKVDSARISSIGAFFEEMAEHWKGWEGVKEYLSIEGELLLEARTDRLGHVFVDVRLRHGAPPQWTLQIPLVIDAGMLENLARRARAFENETARDA